ncbi:hypothetical protein NVV95_11155 [Herbiconiux sp. CPCC 205716]|uniref:Uncharacterized protein n=1 Tax=Herbiconiux gentiana TaxID=2970912 RepID=A0ABT2GFV6_9MICO|nr:hypothetical protein [Herbiconiux gentiana]MCS5715109.1 hypothetical protein [Herbiconiux gentiana]
MTTIETRAAGAITTETGALEETSPVVIVNLCGVQADLFPDEAVRLAVRLIEAAARTEREGESEWP